MFTLVLLVENSEFFFFQGKKTLPGDTSKTTFIRRLALQPTKYFLSEIHMLHKRQLYSEESIKCCLDLSLKRTAAATTKHSIILLRQQEYRDRLLEHFGYLPSGIPCTHSFKEPVLLGS